jgi:hypothetical protein
VLVQLHSFARSLGRHIHPQQQHYHSLHLLRRILGLNCSRVGRRVRQTCCGCCELSTLEIERYKNDRCHNGARHYLSCCDFVTSGEKIRL